MQRKSEEDLWDLVDREAPELEGYLQRYPDERARVEKLREMADGVREVLAAPSEIEHALPERIGEFEITALLGQGGMGLVYAARQAQPNRNVALKVIRRGLIDEARADALFRREVATLARLEHPNIARIYAAGRTPDGQAWLAMELVNGLPLDRFVESRGLGRRERIELFCDVARAVHFAHARGVVHRDLKPQNVLVDTERRARVLDFGLARLTNAAGGIGDEASLVVSRASAGLVGTIAYMSPEQARGERAVDERSDVYSLGAMLYELLSGRRPHELDNATLYEAIQLVSERDPTPLGRLGRGLAGDLEAVVHKALERDPKARYASAEELALDLERYLQKVPVRAARPTLARRAWRFVGRHWLVATLTVLLLFALTGGLIASLGQTRIWQQLTGDWFSSVSPFDDLRWRGDVPEVELEGRWWELLRIDDIDRDFLIGSAKQMAEERWRKRFSEDLLELLNRSGSLALWKVHLTVLDLETREPRLFSNVTMTQEKRRAIYLGRHAWPFDVTQVGPADRVLVSMAEREWELVELDGFSAAAFVEGARQIRARRLQRQREVHAGDFDALYDIYSEVTGRSPGVTIKIRLRDPLSGAVFVSEESRFANRK